ncbi:Protein kinase, catalytic domain-containing protein [Cynara cardunculus var. scolymus]|uniref:Protein kinase, catalytic domain-containing protein n=1 Tax=Cynara cardunculus var. scolymus TaxID=59895 RepID=A0A118JZM3_CYNCS|nr:Protein kinase, catalytic domain-containing protein [Cynara cardunculus var. scolymus]
MRKGRRELKLGGQVYPTTEERWEDKNVKKSKITSNLAVCQVDDCRTDLSSAKDYHRRHWYLLKLEGLLEPVQVVGDTHVGDTGGYTNDGDSNYISRGGFGKVYKGEHIYSGAHVIVAVKRLDSTLGQGIPEFWKEIMMLFRYKHEHLVSLLGFSDEGGENILVYKYLTKVSTCISVAPVSPGSNVLTVNICIGAARGLVSSQSW